ncbi:MAG: thiamine-phosphate kinase [Endomicrobium sp.]|jgi:thiamine-monophosphate kinase|nr:thiamine-phosphate kinase [Endomicrobium sp.]
MKEIKLINIIKNKFSDIKSHDTNINVNIGDDCFCFKFGQENICITKDMLVEDTHFKKKWITAKELGAKAIEVNISDIVAMGTINPKYVFIGLGLPFNISELFVVNLYEGIKKSCDKYGIIISGGDTVRSSKIIISVTLVGIGNKNIIKRNTANVGDIIGVTNNIGDSEAGLKLLYKYGIKHKYNKYEKALIKKHNNPKAKFIEARQMSEYVTSLIDTSDCLFLTLKAIIKEYNKGANIYIDKIPISYNLKKVFSKQKDRLHFTLFGSEDYELLFTVPMKKAKTLKKIIPQISYIGTVNSSNNIFYFWKNKKYEVKYQGYSHFK